MEVELKNKTKMNLIKVCRGESCRESDEENIIDCIEQELKVKVGGKTNGKQVQLFESTCMGHCAQGPCVMINNRVHTGQNPEKLKMILKQFKK